MEPLDINNIIEVQDIKNIIRHHQNLLDFFDDMIEKINKQINNEKPVLNIHLDDISHTKIQYATSSDDDDD